MASRSLQRDLFAKWIPHSSRSKNLCQLVYDQSTILSLYLDNLVFARIRDNLTHACSTDHSADPHSLMTLFMPPVLTIFEDMCGEFQTSRVWLKGGNEWTQILGFQKTLIPSVSDARRPICMTSHPPTPHI
jgi:hypothetical protein